MTETKEPHIGLKIQRIRTIKGIQQKVLADKLGITQSSLSQIENSKDVDEARLKQIADALEVSVDAIKNFNEEAVVNYIQNNNTYDSSMPTNNLATSMTFNPIEKMAELYEKIIAEQKERIKFLEDKLTKQ